MAAAEQVDDETTITPEELRELKRIVNEYAEYLPVLRALKLLVAQAPPTGTPKSTRPRAQPLTAEQQAEVNAKVDKALRRQELKR